MSKAKKTKATELDRIAARLRTALRNQTKNVIDIGKLLIESREHLEHGEWQKWLTKNFDLSYRTAIRYVKAAEYVAKSDTVSLFANVAPTVLYELAEGDFDEYEEAEILKQAKAGQRVDQDLALAICEAFAPDNEDDGGDDAITEDEDGHDSGGDDDDDNNEIEAILDGPPPEVPPTATPPPPTDFALQDFNQAVDTLNRLKTKKPTQFAKTSHGADVLESVESFIHAVTKAIAKGDER